MAPTFKSLGRLRRGFKSHQDKGVGQGTSTSSEVSGSTVPVAPAGSVTELPPPNVPSSPPSLPSPPPSSIQPSAQTEPTISGTPPTDDGADLWEQAYDIFRKEEPVLIEDYNRHLVGNVAPAADLSSRQSVEAVLKKLLEYREKKQWKIPFPGHDIKIRTQVEGLAKFLQWSDPFIQEAVSTQPYAALAWSGVSLLLPVSSRCTSGLLSSC
jgi:hypothetical protein